MRAKMNRSEKLANEADELLAKAETAMAALEAAEAEGYISDAKKVMADSDAQLYPEYEMLVGRVKEDEARLPEVRKARERRDLEAIIAKRKEKIEEQSARLKKAVKALEGATLEKSAVDEAADAGGDLLDALK